MGLLSTEVEVVLHNNIKYYESLGYDIPKRINKKNQVVNDIGSKISVRIEDLPPQSSVCVDVECDNCGKKYKKLFFDYQKTKKMFGDKIYCVHCIQKMTKKKVEYYEEKDRMKFYPDYSEFIKKVLKRDNYTCQCCGTCEGDIVVHHLDGYDWCKDKRTDDTNGISLCKKCHYNFHSKYGFGKNTKRQFEEWMGNIKIELESFNGIIIPTRKIYCYEEDKIYNSADDYAHEQNLASTSGIYKVCNNEEKCYTANGKHIFWYDEYINLNNEEINERISKSVKTNYNKVICLTTNIIYESIADGARKENASSTSIDRCCRNQCSHVRTKDGRLTQWMFYDDFLKLNKNESDGD